MSHVYFLRFTDLKHKYGYHETREVFASEHYDDNSLSCVRFDARLVVRFGLSMKDEERQQFLAEPSHYIFNMFYDHHQRRFEVVPKPHLFEGQSPDTFTNGPEFECVSAHESEDDSPKKRRRRSKRLKKKIHG